MCTFKKSTRPDTRFQQEKVEQKHRTIKFLWIQFGQNFSIALNFNIRMVPSGYISLLYSISKKPLEYWTKEQSHTGKVHKTVDFDLHENVRSLLSPTMYLCLSCDIIQVIDIQDLQKCNSPDTSITCPARAWQLLSIPLPFLVIIMKNMSVQCRLKIQIADANGDRHHFHFSNEPFESDSSIRGPVISRVPMKLEPGWNRVELDLADLTRKVFDSEYKATQRISICSNCRVRRVYMVDRHYKDTDISPGLCRAFLDHYMIKRGISRTSEDSKFLKNVKTKSSQLVNDYFSRSLRNDHNDVVDFDPKDKSRLIVAISKLGDQPEGTPPTESRCGTSRVTPDGSRISVKLTRNTSRGKNHKPLHSVERNCSTIAKPLQGQSTVTAETTNQTPKNNTEEKMTGKE